MKKMRLEEIKEKISNKKIYLYSVVIVFAIILFLYVIEGYAPFGINSLATSDAEIQYLDFFSYFKDVLLGKNSINYSFNCGMGQNMIAVFSYYLLSPFNLLLIIFDKSNIEVFFNLAIMLKLCIASITFAFFLKHRFKSNLKDYLVVLLSVSYALSQYNISQTSNIMWLDGVYMLPLMLLGVYNVVNDKRSILLICSTAISIIFNWYIGIINCLFSIIWFILENVIYEINLKDKFCFKERKGVLLRKIVKYITAIIIGGIISLLILWPTFISLKSGRGKIDFDIFKNIGLKGNILSVIPEYTLGAVSSENKVSLFCGGLALIGVLNLLFSNKVSKKERIAFGVFLTFIVLMFYWYVLFNVFSLLKYTNSYWYRYAYLGIFGILFMAAYFYKGEFKADLKITKSVLIFIILLIILNYILKVNEMFKMYLTIAFIIAIILSLIFINYAQNKKKLVKKLSVVILYIIVIAEMLCSTKFLMDIYHSSSSREFSKYIKEGEEQINDIKNYDDGFYRISQTSTRNMDLKNNLTANYNESMAFKYMGISSYTSDPDRNQREFLHNIGYKKEGDNFNIINTSILGADSLLGVKYILSDYPINGLIETKIPEKNGKKVYENIYAMPLAFTYKENDKLLTSNENNTENPFRQQNELYSKLLNKDVELYIPLNYLYEETVESRTKVVKTYNLEIPKGNYAIYGSIGSFESAEEKEIFLNVNDDSKIKYMSWLAPSVFYIPTIEGDNSAKVELISNMILNIDYEWFYALDLDVLKEIKEEITNDNVKINNFENGKVNINVQNNNDEKLIVSIPYDSGWKVTVNGKKVTPELFADCLMMISLENGDNNIEMTYSTPYINLGIIATIFGIICLILVIINENKCKKQL